MAESFSIDVNLNGQTTNATEINQSQPRNTSFSPNRKIGNGSRGLMAAGAIQLGKQATSTVLSRVGEFSGNRQLQNKINNVIKVKNYGTTLVQGVLAGAALGGPIGGGVGGGVAAASIIFDVTVQNVDNNNEIFKRNQNAQYLRESTIYSNNNNRSGGNQ